MTFKKIIRFVNFYLSKNRKIDIEKNLDAKIWVQFILLKNQLKSVNKNNL